MAALQGSFVTGAVSLTGGTAQTVLQVVPPSNQRLKIIGVRLSFDGTNSANTPVTVQLLRQTTAGTFTNTSVSPVKYNEPAGVSETLQTTGQTAVTVEPTAGNILESYTVPAFGGTVIYSAPPGQEMIVPGGTRWGVKASAAQTVNMATTVIYEE